MSLYDVRKLYLTFSQRTDLVHPTTYANLGADQIINIAQRDLDLRGPESQRRARRFFSPPSGAYRIFLRDCYAVEDVWTIGGTASNARTKLTFLDRDAFWAKYPTLATSLGSTLTPPVQTEDDSTTAGSPTYYTVEVSRVAPEQDGIEDAAAFSYGASTAIFGDWFKGRQVVWSPPASTSYDFEILGGFYSKLLEEDGDSSYWTEEHPQVLAQMACYHTELMYRNSAGAELWLAAVNRGLGLTMTGDIYESQRHRTQMEG